MTTLLLCTATTTLLGPGAHQLEQLYGALTLRTLRDCSGVLYALGRSLQDDWLLLGLIVAYADPFVVLLKCATVCALLAWTS